MLKIGLTGGIGSGKSTVARIFAILGIPVYHADLEAKRLMQEDPELKRAIISHFSEKAYPNDVLDRAFLSKAVFQNRQKLELLNSLVHPITIRDGREWMNRQTAPYVIKEAALIFESGSQGEFDLIIGVFAPVSLRVLRTMKRDHTDRMEVLKRMDNQVDDEIKMKLCDHTLLNDEQHPVIPQVISLHEKLLLLKQTDDRHE